MRMQEMIGLAVFDVEQGKRVGKVLDVLLGGDWSITGIQLENRSLFSSSVKVVLWDDIAAYGEDAVMIRNQQAVCKWEAEHIQNTFLSGPGKLKDLSVLTEDGIRIGYVTDVYFEHELGNTITGIEISDGFFTDLMEGRKMLPFVPEMTRGENAIMVPRSSEQLLEKP
ncbi:photosystem reaction center subunit H [Paenibacillus oralis]|uniref:Photosystem reaction center subunit H n=1 Tax=Paenibacillus oralis TaxID=2490856 RepID=A0A3P3U9M3_9BACL|nr:PRC-barrel domain-containing protein [Paenibacillus oralis]RRJ67062.1 photosystem reaction center subunit H [Paenibacillus oralis]